MEAAAYQRKGDEHNHPVDCRPSDRFEAGWLAHRKWTEWVALATREHQDPTIEDAIALLRELGAELRTHYDGTPPQIEAIETVCADLNNTFRVAREEPARTHEYEMPEAAWMVLQIRSVLEGDDIPSNDAERVAHLVVAALAREEPLGPHYHGRSVCTGESCTTHDGLIDMSMSAAREDTGQPPAPDIISTEPIPPEDLERASRYVKGRGWVGEDTERPDLRKAINELGVEVDSIPSYSFSMSDQHVFGRMRAIIARVRGHKRSGWDDSRPCDCGHRYGQHDQEYGIICEVEGCECHQLRQSQDTGRPDGVGLIAAERDRQVSEEGWTPEHDDTHTNGSLVLAAAWYALAEAVRWNPASVRPAWPWGRTPPKRDGDRVRELVKAGALIAAEIDRLHRLRAKG